MNSEQHPFETLDDQDSNNPHFIRHATHIGDLILELPVANPNYIRDKNQSDDDPYGVTSID